MKSPGSVLVRAAESRFQNLMNTAVAPCPPLHACRAASTRTADSQGKEGEVTQPQARGMCGVWPPVLPYLEYQWSLYYSHFFHLYGCSKLQV